jgi:HEPN domain-containing protein
MVDINKQIEFWMNGASEDIEVARELLSNNRYRHGLFFLHLALEKILKAHVCRNINDLAPRIHNLVRLAEAASLNLKQHFIDILAELNAFNIEGRYPDSAFIPVTQEEAADYLYRAEEVFQWLMSQLKS